MTGPSTALSGTSDRATRPPKAEIYQITSVTVESLRYVIVLVCVHHQAKFSLTDTQYRFALSSCINFSLVDGSFHLGRFNKVITELFDPELGPGQEWIDNLLRFFERWVWWHL